MLRFRGAQSLRQRLLLATLAGRPVRVDDIRAREASPGLQDHEASLLRLLEKVTNGCVIEINETGTRLRYRPGVITGGAGLAHDCGSTRGIGYFVEPLILLALWAKKPLAITLRGLTHGGPGDPCVDTLRAVTLPLLKRFGVDAGSLELKLVRRGAPPAGGGEVLLKLAPAPALRLTPPAWTDEGMVKRVRGVAFCCRVAPQAASRMVDAARGLLNKLLADVYIFVDHASGADAGRSPGFGLALVAETTTGCLISAEAYAPGPSGSHAKGGGSGAGEDGAAEAEPTLPEDVGARAAGALLEQIGRGGVADTGHQSLLLSLCALGPEDLCKLRLGPLSPHATRTLRAIRDVLGITFQIAPEAASGTLFLTCVGAGVRNLAKKVT